MLSAVTLDDASGTPVVLHETAKRVLISAGGLIGIGSLRDSKRVRPTGHGGISETRWEDGKLIVLGGEVLSNVSVADAMAEFRTVTAPMLQTLDVGPALLKWQEDVAGLALQRLVKLDSDVSPTLQEAAAIVNYQAQFFAEDPRAYSQTLTTVNSLALSTSVGGAVFPDPFNVQFAAASGGVAVCTNVGNRPTPPIFRVLGAFTNPVITRQSNQAKLSLVGTIGAGDYLELDVANRTVKLNGSSNAANLLDSPNCDWASMEVPSGTETFTLRAQSNDGNAGLTVFYRAAYA
jgi:hypothetical protein